MSSPHLPKNMLKCLPATLLGKSFHSQPNSISLSTSKIKNTSSCTIKTEMWNKHFGYEHVRTTLLATNNWTYESACFPFKADFKTSSVFCGKLDKNLYGMDLVKSLNIVKTLLAHKHD